MAIVSIGDMAQHFLSTRHNTMLKTRLNTLTQELSTGRAQNLPARLGGDLGRYSSIEHNLTVLDGYQTALSETANTLSVMQSTLDRVDGLRAGLAGSLLPITADSSPGQRQEAAATARNSFGTIVNSLNTRLADRSLFSGVATDRAALAPGTTILADLSAAVALVAPIDADGLIAAVDAWFDDPGGFATTGFLGDPGNPVSRRVDANQVVDITAKADDPAIKAMLKAAAYSALLDGSVPMTGDEAAKIMRKSGEGLMTAGHGLAELQARLGGIEGRVEEIKTSQTAQKTALTLMRNDMVSADPFETAAALQEVQIQLETHYTVTARLSRLSLTEYLR